MNGNINFRAILDGADCNWKAGNIIGSWGLIDIGSRFTHTNLTWEACSWAGGKCLQGGCGE